MELEQEVAELQRQLAMIDLLTRSARRGHVNDLEFLLLKRGDLKVKMYQEPGHALPHIHIDYGRKNHIAAYSIDPVSRLAGTLEKKYEQTATEWISSRRLQLLELWAAVQSGRDPSSLVVQLAGDA